MHRKAPNPKRARRKPRFAPLHGPGDLPEDITPCAGAAPEGS
ncbi:hypothetical protein Y88_3629 [Novosphingobium nitrogenifigens DSM 19370]|uniref:Uncharacterized protein n=1 Tax=Novosphingobium nitrogenifigens DSM 19370 TaxID=983920 RepID=F1ZD86_9SPHN|nr:hypothetical protein Y88_3629 [Novosphingobium nitrogenifigens DSM 19370]